MSTRKSSRIRRLSERAKEMSSTTANERVVVVPHRSVLKDLKSINNINNVIVEEDKLQSMHGLSRKFQQDNEDNVNSQINFKRRKLDSELSESEQELVKNEPCEKDQLYHEDISNFLMPVNNILNFINIKSTDDNDDDILKIEHQSPIMRDDNESNDNNNDEIDSDSLIKESERKFEKLLAITSDSTEKFENFSWIRNNDGLERWPICKKPIYQQKEQIKTTPQEKKFSSTTTSQPADDRIQHLSLEEYLNYDSMSSLTDDDSESEVSEKSSPAPEDISTLPSSIFTKKFYPSQLEYRYHEHLNLALTDIAIKNIDYSIGGNNNIDLLDKNTTIGRGKTTNYTNAIKKRATNNDVYLTDVADYNEFLI